MSTLYDITSDILEYNGYRALHAGDDWEHPFEVERPAGTPLSLAGAKLYFTIKYKPSDSDTEAELQYDSTDPTEIEVTDAVAGEFTLKLKAADTVDMEGFWFYDIQVVLSSSEVVTLARGNIEFLRNITKAVS